MTGETSQQDDTVAALTTFQRTSEAYFDAREKLTEALGALVGRRIDIIGYPSSKVIASNVDENGAVLRRTAVPSYRSRLTEDDCVPREPKSILDQMVLAMNPSGLHVAATSVETPKRQYDVLAYIFQLQGIKQLRLLENIDK